MSLWQDSKELIYKNVVKLTKDVLVIFSNILI